MIKDTHRQGTPRAAIGRWAALSGAANNLSLAMSRAFRAKESLRTWLGHVMI